MSSNCQMSRLEESDEGVILGVCGIRVDVGVLACLSLVAGVGQNQKDFTGRGCPEGRGPRADCLALSLGADASLAARTFAKRAS
jgi:hypothetical protein